MIRKIVLLALLVLTGTAAPTGLAQDGTASPDDPSDLYQNDGESGQDASDDCRSSKLALEPDQPVHAGQGHLVPGDDLGDTWNLAVGSGTVTVLLNTEPLVSGGTAYIPTAGAEIQLEVFAFEKIPPGPPVVGEEQVVGALLLCEEPTYSSHVISGQQTSLTFEVERGVSYFVQVEISGLGHGGLPYSPVPLNGHCRPACFQAYHLGVSG